MKKSIIIFFILLIGVILSTYTINKAETIQTGMANPWTYCEADFDCAEKVSQIKFPLRLSNYWISAMKGMIEISYPLDEFRDVTVRKGKNSFGRDISGVYTKYPKTKTMKLDNGYVIKTKGTRTKVYVATMSDANWNYSAYCKEGMSKKEAKGVFQVIFEAEHGND